MIIKLKCDFNIVSTLVLREIKYGDKSVELN